MLQDITLLYSLGGYLIIEGAQFNLIEKVADVVVGIGLRYSKKVKVTVHKKYLDDEVYFEKEKSRK